MKNQIVIKNDKCIAMASCREETPVMGEVCKMLPLSKAHKGGVMISGSPTLGGVSIEMLLERYNESIKGKKLKSVDDYVKGFITFLTQNQKLFFPKEKIEEEMIKDVQLYHIKYFIAPFDEATEDSEEEVDESKMVAILKEIYARAEHSNKYADDMKCPFAPVDITNNDMFIWSNIEDHEESLDPRTKEIINAAYRKKGRMGRCIRLVFAGYGQSDSPEVRIIELYRVIQPVEDGEMVIDYLEIDASEYGDQVLSFAGSENMIGLCVTGIDDDYAAYSENLLHQLSGNVIQEVEKKIAKASYRKAFQKDVNMKEIILAEVKALQDQLFEYSYSSYGDPLSDRIAKMSPDQLASTAEALLMISLFRQRLLAEEQASFSPIDVAIITKADGFAWYKRKEALTQK